MSVSALYVMAHIKNIKHFTIEGDSDPKYWFLNTRGHDTVRVDLYLTCMVEMIALMSKIKLCLIPTVKSK